MPNVWLRLTWIDVFRLVGKMNVDMESLCVSNYTWVQRIVLIAPHKYHCVLCVNLSLICSEHHIKVRWCTFEILIINIQTIWWNKMRKMDRYYVATEVEMYLLVFRSIFCSHQHISFGTVSLDRRNCPKSRHTINYTHLEWVQAMEFSPFSFWGNFGFVSFRNKNALNFSFWVKH